MQFAKNIVPFFRFPDRGKKSITKITIVKKKTFKNTITHHAPTFSLHKKLIKKIHINNNNNKKTTNFCGKCVLNMGKKMF